MAIITRQPETQQPTPQPGQPHGPRRNLAGRIALALIAVAALAGAVIFAVTSGHSGGKPAATHPTPTPAVSAPNQPGSTATPGVVPGATNAGDPAQWPAAQATPPSLDSLYNSPPDVPAIVRTLQAYQDWVYSHPDPALVGNFMLPNSSYYKGQVNDLTVLKSRGWHALPNPTEIDFIKVTQVPQPYKTASGQPQLINGHPAYHGGVAVIVFNFPGGPYVDQSGKVVQTAPGVGQVGYDWTLAQGLDGRWRIADEGRLNPPGGIAVLEQG